MELQELDLLASAKASYCFNFYFMNMASSYKINVSPINKIYNQANWCNYTINIPFDTLSFLNPRALPKGVFLICGDQAWAGIPSRIKGRPCTPGLLTMLTPNITLLQEWKQQKNQLACFKRAYTPFDENCDATFFDWPKSKRVAVSIFLP